MAPAVSQSGISKPHRKRQSRVSNSDRAPSVQSRQEPRAYLQLALQRSGAPPFLPVRLGLAGRSALVLRNISPATGRPSSSTSILITARTHSLAALAAQST